MIKVAIVVACCGLSSSVRAASPTPTPGQLDTTFVPAPGTYDAVNVVIPQSDGKVLAAGEPLGLKSDMQQFGVR